MNTKQIQFNRQRMIALLLAGLILALAASLAWAGVEASGSSFSLHPGYPEQSAINVVCPIAEGSKLGSGTDGVSFRGCESEVLPWSPLRFIAGRKPGVGVGSTAFHYFLQPGQPGPSAAVVVFSEGSKPEGVGNGGTEYESEGLPVSPPGFIAGGRGGIFGDC